MRTIVVAVLRFLSIRMEVGMVLSCFRGVIRDFTFKTEPISLPPAHPFCFSLNYPPISSSIWLHPRGM